MRKAVAALHTTSNDLVVLAQDGGDHPRKPGRQSEDYKGIKNRESFHYLVQGSPEADGAECREEEIASTYKSGYCEKQFIPRNGHGGNGRRPSLTFRKSCP